MGREREWKGRGKGEGEGGGECEYGREGGGKVVVHFMIYAWLRTCTCMYRLINQCSSTSVCDLSSLSSFSFCNF